MLEKISDFNIRFKEAMETRGIKAIEISEKTGISESTLSQYKSGYSKPKDKRLALIADVLDVDPAWLMGLNVPMKTTKYDSIEDSEIIDQFKSLSPEKKAEFRNFLKFLQSDV